MDYLQEAIRRFDVARGGNSDAALFERDAEMFLNISIAQSLATIAAKQAAPEKRPSVVEIGDTIIQMEGVAEVSWSEPNLDPDSVFTVWVSYSDGRARLLEDDKAATFLQAYRAYCGLDAETDDMPPDLEPINWMRQYDQLADLLRDVLGDLPEGFTSPAVEVARAELQPF